MPDALPDKKLTLKQRKWLKLYIETGNATEAAAQVYDAKDREGAAQIGWENLKKLDIRELMEEKGVSDHRLVTKIDEGLEATKLATSFTEADQLIPDYATRHKYLETSLKLKKHLTPQDAPQNTTNVLVIPGELLGKYGITSNTESSSAG